MKDANGSRFELLLGEADWGHCTHVGDDGVTRTLAEGWADAATRSRLPLSFDPQAQTVALSRRISRFRAAPSDVPPDPARRLGAAADAFGSVYWVADGGARIDVLSSGSRTVSVYAEANPADDTPRSAPGDFAPLAPSPTPPPRVLRGLAVTAEHYLVAGVRPDDRRSGGLRVFDLVGGGPPLALTWPAAWPFVSHDLAPRPGGGLAVLDREHRRVWLLDRRLGMTAVFTVETDDASRPDDFAAVNAPPAPIASPEPPSTPPWFDLVVDAAGGDDPVAIEVLADDAVLVMDGAGTDGFALLSLYVGGALAGRVSTRAVLDVIDPDERAGFMLRGYDLALMARPAAEPARLVVASHEGNQCFAFDLLRDRPALALDPIETFLPMRRFAGRGLVRRVVAAEALTVAQDTGLLYDGMGTWLPLVAQTRPRFAPWAQLTTPPLDGDEPGRQWHRLVIDGCVPPGTAVGVETRAADDPDELVDQSFEHEPAPMLRPGGSELPWILDGPGAHVDAALGKGSWELLFQRARGRYLQLRLTLSGDELATPSLSALRAWAPRFSYARQYLPAVYQEDETSADFLERFLANFEGVFTALEDRIATAAALFDLRTAPGDTLEWLAGWLGLVLDPAVDEARKRLLIRFAIPLYQYRGTTQGLRLATELVLSPCIRPRDFALPTRSQDQPYGIRIVERYLTRRLPPALLGETVVDAPRLVASGTRWSPAEGAEGLQRRYRDALRRAEVPDADSAVWRPVSPPAGADLWRAVSAEELGAVPQLAETLASRWREYLAALAEADRHGMGPDLPMRWPTDPSQRVVWATFIARALDPDLRRWLTRWQSFLGRRYQRVDDPAFVNAWGAGWPGFELVPAPDVLPASDTALADWALFETRLEPMARTAHRFSVLLPTSGPLADAAALERRIEWARRVVTLEKPAHTVFDVRPYWAMFRTGQARLGLDTVLGQGSRAPELAPQLIVGSGHVGAGRLALEPRPPRDRLLLAC
ncbi:MAG TPA: phage tail protein [Methylomirabilota bacterium]|nr:phage tail protein [Methylomirabilota bacterium]